MATRTYFKDVTESISSFAVQDTVRDAERTLLLATTYNSKLIDIPNELDWMPHSANNEVFPVETHFGYPYAFEVSSWYQVHVRRVVPGTVPNPGLEDRP